jgi:hypothetical protein
MHGATIKINNFFLCNETKYSTILTVFSKKYKWEFYNRWIGAVLYKLYLTEQEVPPLWQLQTSGESKCGLNKQNIKYWQATSAHEAISHGWLRKFSAIP